MAVGSRGNVAERPSASGAGSLTSDHWKRYGPPCAGLGLSRALPHDGAVTEGAMIDPDRARRLAEVALAASGAEATEVSIGATEQALNRFTHEHPVQNVHRQEVSIAVRVHEGGRQGKASTGTPTEDAVRRTVERARAAARLAPPQELAPMPGQPGGYALRGGGPLRADPEAAAAAVGRIAETARGADCRMTGIHHGCSTLRLVANSAGLLVHDWDTVAQVSVSAFKEDGAGWA